MIFAPSGIACDGRPTEAQTGNKIMIGVTVILILLCAVGTMCGSWRRSAKKLEGITRVPAGQSIISPRLPEIGVPPSSRQVAIPRDPPALFKAFDLHDNLHEIFSLNVRPGEFSCFDGLRAISCGWVVLYHVILWQTRWINNPDALLPPNGLLGQWWAQPMFNFRSVFAPHTQAGPLAPILHLHRSLTDVPLLWCILSACLSGRQRHAVRGHVPVHLGVPGHVPAAQEAGA